MSMKYALALTASLALALPAQAAIEIDESQPFGPTYGSAMADVAVAKPLQLAGAALGTVAYALSLPFSIASGSVDSSFENLVERPWNALGRCVGCTAAYDEYRLSQPQGQVRFVITEPSEVIINSSDAVLVNP